jgi:hypothetical protein
MTPAPTRARRTALGLAVNERGSFQVAVRHDGELPLNVSVTATASPGLDVRIRRVGYVPVAHHSTGVPFEPADLDGIGHIPGWVPDPLFEETSLLLPPRETHAFWFSVAPRRGAAPGRHEVRVELIPEQGSRQSLRIPVQLCPVRIAPRRNFPVMQWFYADALLDAYHCAGFNDRFWQVAEAYLRDLAAHGQDTVNVPIFTPPLDGVKRPSQLLHVTRRGRGEYSFDWRDVKRYVDLARRCGLRRFEWTHLFTQWGAQYAIRIYHGQGTDERLLWPAQTDGTAPVYRRFLAAFLPEFHRFLESENLLKHSLFHLSDEPHGEEHRARYRRARAMLAELAPWMKVMDALSEIAYGREGLTDLPIASIRTALDFQGEGIASGCYFCCNPRGRFLNRLMDTPLPKIRMSGWLFYRWPFKAFLHWGYNYWYRSQTRELIDPYRVNDAHNWPAWPSGDPFLVYPGKDGPVDSIRWEIFAESLQDYALLQTLEVPRNAPLLRALRSFEDFPKDENWIERTRTRLFV